MENAKFPPSPPEENALIPSVLPVDLSLAAFQDDICLAYTRKTLLRGGSVEIACNMVQFNNGFVEDPSKPGIALLRDSIMSLAITFYGSQHRQMKIKNRGYQQYGNVLRQLNTHLSQPELQTTNETILTALTCMLLEIFLPTGPNNFLKHMHGIECMLEIRGPPSLDDNETALLFHGLRLLSIIGGLATSRPSLYSRPEWKKMPCIQKDEAGMLRHRMFMILADATRLRYERNVALSMELKENHPALILETRSLLTCLEEIRSDWVIFNEKHLDESTSQMGKELRIANHVSATAHMLYHTTHICLLEILESLEPSSKYASLRNAAAIKIMKSLELKAYEQRTGAPESNTIGFVATKVAWQALGGFHSPEGRKLAKVVKSAVNGVFAVGAWEDKAQMGDVLWNNWTDKTPQPPGFLKNINARPMMMAQHEIIDIGNRSLPIYMFPNIRF